MYGRKAKAETAAEKAGYRNSPGGPTPSPEHGEPEPDRDDDAAEELLRLLREPDHKRVETFNSVLSVVLMAAETKNLAVLRDTGRTLKRMYIAALAQSYLP